MMAAPSRYCFPHLLKVWHQCGMPARTNRLRTASPPFHVSDPCTCGSRNFACSTGPLALAVVRLKEARYSAKGNMRAAACYCMLIRRAHHAPGDFWCGDAKDNKDPRMFVCPVHSQRLPLLPVVPPTISAQLAGFGRHRHLRQRRILLIQQLR